MSIIEKQDINPYSYLTPNYKLEMKYSRKSTLIKMFLFTNFYHTSSLPNAVEILEKKLPQVLKTQCFNDLNLPFQAEVKNTEIGHLFEHILLQYLCQEKIKKGYRRASFRGVTKWNWKNEAKGTFNIEVELKAADIIYLEAALEKTINLINTILPKN